MAAAESKDGATTPLSPSPAQSPTLASTPAPSSVTLGATPTSASQSSTPATKSRGVAPDKAKRLAASQAIENPNNTEFGLFDEFELDWHPEADITEATHGWVPNAWLPGANDLIFDGLGSLTRDASMFWCHAVMM